MLRVDRAQPVCTSQDGTSGCPNACRTARALVTDVVVKIVSLVAAADQDLYTQLRLGALHLLLGAPLVVQSLGHSFQRRRSCCPTWPMVPHEKTLR